MFTGMPLENYMSAAGPKQTETETFIFTEERIPKEISQQCCMRCI